MPRILICGLTVLCAAGFATMACASPTFPKGAQALEIQLLATQDAQTKAWIKDEAAREATLHILSDETPRNAARKSMPSAENRHV